MSKQMIEVLLSSQVLVMYLGLSQIVSDWSMTPIFQIDINISSYELLRIEIDLMTYEIEI